MFSNLQLQSRYQERRSITHAFCCAQPCQCVLSQPAANPHSRSSARNRPTLAQGWQWGRFRATLVSPDFFFVKSSSRYSSSCAFYRPHLRKVLRDRKFSNVLMCKSSSRYSPVRFLTATFPDRSAKPRRQTPYFGDRRSHTAGKKAVFRMNSQASKPLLSSTASARERLLLPMLRAWWEDWWRLPLDIRP